MVEASMSDARQIVGQRHLNMQNMYAAEVILFVHTKQEYFVIIQVIDGLTSDGCTIISQKEYHRYFTVKITI